MSVQSVIQKKVSKIEFWVTSVTSVDFDLINMALVIRLQLQERKLQLRDDIIWAKYGSSNNPNERTYRILVSVIQRTFL